MDHVHNRDLQNGVIDLTGSDDENGKGENFCHIYLSFSLSSLLLLLLFSEIDLTDTDDEMLFQPINCLSPDSPEISPRYDPTSPVHFPESPPNLSPDYLPPFPDYNPPHSPPIPIYAPIYPVFLPYPEMYAPASPENIEPPASPVFFDSDSDISLDSGFNSVNSPIFDFEVSNLIIIKLYFSTLLIDFNIYVNIKFCFVSFLFSNGLFTAEIILLESSFLFLCQPHIQI